MGVCECYCGCQLDAMYECCECVFCGDCWGDHVEFSHDAEIDEV